MSWSVTASGAVAAVATEIAKQLDNVLKASYITDPAEQRQITDTKELVAKVLGDFSEGCGVTVNASGSLSSWQNGQKLYSYTVDVKPLYNWVT